MLVPMVRCDNPKCTNVGSPEWVDEEGPSVDPAKYSGPYGWIDTEISFVGTGPSLHVDACSVKCLTPAVQDLLDAWRRREQDEYS